MFDETTRHIVLAVSVLLPLLYIFGLIFSMKSHYRLIEEEEHLIQESNESEIDIDSKLPPRVQVGYTVGIHGSMFDIDRTASESVHEELGDSGNVSKEREDLTETVVVRFFPPFFVDHFECKCNAALSKDKLWSKKVCVCVFLVSLVLFALIIEKVQRLSRILTLSPSYSLSSDACHQVAESIPLTLQQLQMSNAFAAVSVLSWAPGIPDLILAVLFAWQNDISAAIDVGLAAALTVTM